MVTSSSLSAAGSSQAPSEVRWLARRAISPSSASVAPATTKITERPAEPAVDDAQHERRNQQQAQQRQLIGNGQDRLGGHRAPSAARPRAARRWRSGRRRVTGCSSRKAPPSRAITPGRHRPPHRRDTPGGPAARRDLDRRASHCAVAARRRISDSTRLHHVGDVGAAQRRRRAGRCSSRTPPSPRPAPSPRSTAGPSGRARRSPRAGAAAPPPARRRDAPRAAPPDRRASPPAMRRICAVLRRQGGVARRSRSAAMAVVVAGVGSRAAARS